MTDEHNERKSYSLLLWGDKGVDHGALNEDPLRNGCSDHIWIEFREDNGLIENPKVNVSLSGIVDLKQYIPQGLLQCCEMESWADKQDADNWEIYFSKDFIESIAKNLPSKSFAVSLELLCKYKEWPYPLDMLPEIREAMQCIVSETLYQYRIEAAANYEKREADGTARKAWDDTVNKYMESRIAYFGRTANGEPAIFTSGVTVMSLDRNIDEYGNKRKGFPASSPSVEAHGWILRNGAVEQFTHTPAGFAPRTPLPLFYLPEDYDINELLELMNESVGESEEANSINSIRNLKNTGNMRGHVYMDCAPPENTLASIFLNLKKDVSDTAIQIASENKWNSITKIRIRQKDIENAFISYFNVPAEPKIQEQDNKDLSATNESGVQLKTGEGDSIRLIEGLTFGKDGNSTIITNRKKTDYIYMVCKSAQPIVPQGESENYLHSYSEIQKEKTLNWFKYGNIKKPEANNNFDEDYVALTEGYDFFNRARIRKSPGFIQSFAGRNKLSVVKHPSFSTSEASGEAAAARVNTVLANATIVQNAFSAKNEGINESDIEIASINETLKRYGWLEKERNSTVYAPTAPFPASPYLSFLPGHENTEVIGRNQDAVIEDFKKNKEASKKPEEFMAVARKTELLDKDGFNIESMDNYGSYLWNRQKAESEGQDIFELLPHTGVEMSADNEKIRKYALPEYYACAFDEPVNITGGLIRPYESLRFTNTLSRNSTELEDRRKEDEAVSEIIKENGPHAYLKEWEQSI